jgi:hypothetical protein
MQITLAWLLQRSPNILLIPGTLPSNIFAKISGLQLYIFPPK